MTTPSRTTPSAIVAPRPTMLPVTSAPGPMVTSTTTTPPHTTALAPAADPAPATAPPDSRAPAATVASASRTDPPHAPGTAGDGMRPSTRSHEPRTNASGVPTSNQYAD